MDLNFYKGLRILVKKVLIFKEPVSLRLLTRGLGLTFHSKDGVAYSKNGHHQFVYVTV